MVTMYFLHTLSICGTSNHSDDLFLEACAGHLPIHRLLVGLLVESSSQRENGLDGRGPSPQQACLVNGNTTGVVGQYPTILQATNIYVI